MIFLPANRESLSTLKNILTEYTKISGLELNQSKTEVMTIYDGDPILLKEIVNMVGFSNAESITHLGINFDHKLNELQTNWSSKLEKMKRLRNFFNSLNLPFAAKINVIKTFFLSQICYLAPVIAPNIAIIDEIRNLILKFLSPKRNLFPLHRIFLECNKGGLGIPDPSVFIDNIALKFAFRGLESVQPWAGQIKSFFHSNNLCLSSSNRTEPPTEPSCCGRLIKLIDDFNVNFFRDSRFYSTNIFYSKAIFSPLTNLRGNSLPPSLMGTIYENIKIIDCIDFNNKKFLTYGQLINKFQERLSYNDYFLIYSILSKNVVRTEIPNNRPKTFSLPFLYRKNPATKYIKSFLNKTLVDISKFTSIEFFNIYCNSEFDEIQSKKFLNVWSLNFLPVEVRNFALMRNNNKLILNYQRSRFSGTGPNCSFCMFYPCTDDIVETPEHLFFLCRITKGLIDSYFNNLIEDMNLDWKEIFFKGAKCTDVKVRHYINTEVTLFSHYIFSVRAIKKLPSFAGLKYHIAMIKKVMFLTSRKYRGIVNHILEKKSGCFIEHLKILENLPG